MNILFVHNAYQQFGGEDAVVDSEMVLLRAHGHQVALYQRHNDELHILHRVAPRAAAPRQAHAAPNRMAPACVASTSVAANAAQAWPPRALMQAGAAVSAVWSRPSARELGRLCDTFQPDVIHVHNTFPLISPSIYWAAARRQIPVVQTLHNFRLLCPQGTFLRNGKVCEDCLGKLPWRAVVRKCYRASVTQSAVLALMLGTHRAIGTYRNRVTRFIALNAFARARFIGAGLRPEQVCVKPNFVDCPILPGSRARQGGLFVGRLADEKGVGTMLDALRAGAATTITVIGAGPLQDAVAQASGVRYLGFRTRAEIMEQMRASAFLLVPSLCLEQLPTTILEAFACGLPVLASRQGALAHIVEDGVTGLLFDPGNADDLAQKIAWAAAHGAEMAVMGRRARAVYEAKYTPSINYRMLLEIYDDAITAIGRERHVAQGTGRAGNLG